MNKRRPTIAELEEALQELHSAVDQEIMGDTDIQDDSLLMNAMQRAARLIRSDAAPKEGT